MSSRLHTFFYSNSRKQPFLTFILIIEKYLKRKRNAPKKKFDDKMKKRNLKFFAIEDCVPTKCHTLNKEIGSYYF